MQLSKGDKATEVEHALEKAGLTSWQAVFEEMADGKCFTMDKDTDEKEGRLWIDDLDHAQLLRHAHALQYRAPFGLLQTMCCWCCRLTGQDATSRPQPPASLPDSLPHPPAQSDFMTVQPPHPSMSLGQLPSGLSPMPAGAAPPHFPGPPNQISSSLGPGSQSLHQAALLARTAQHSCYCLPAAAVDVLLHRRRAANYMY